MIFNPTAGGSRGRRYAKVVERLRDGGCAIHEQPTAKRGDAESFAATLRPNSCDTLVAAGGDGTINEVVNGLMANPDPLARALPLAVLPLGTANVLAAEIGLSVSPAEIASEILTGRPQPISVGVANGRHFMLMAGVGFDAHVVSQVDSRMKKRIGKGAYVLQTLRQLRKFGFPSYRVTVDGETFEVASAIVANAHFYGGRFVAAPRARLDAPTLEVCLFGRSGRLHAMRYAAALGLNLLSRLGDYRVVTGSTIEIRGPLEDPLQGDGDIIASLPAEIAVCPGALNLLMPRG
jgi:YegS/Rv2252/BmrU family lipid kinase